MILTSHQKSFWQLHSCRVVRDCRYDFENVFGYVPNMGISKAERLRRGDSMMTHAMVLTAVHTDDVSDFAFRVRSHCENTKSKTDNFQMGSLPLFCYVANSITLTIVQCEQTLRPFSHSGDSLRSKFGSWS